MFKPALFKFKAAAAKYMFMIVSWIMLNKDEINYCTVLLSVHYKTSFVIDLDHLDTLCAFSKVKHI